MLVLQMPPTFCCISLSKNPSRHFKGTDYRLIIAYCEEVN